MYIPISSLNILSDVQSYVFCAMSSSKGWDGRVHSNSALPVELNFLIKWTEFESFETCFF